MAEVRIREGGGKAQLERMWVRVKQVQADLEKQESNLKTTTLIYKEKSSFTVYIFWKKTHVFYL